MVDRVALFVTCLGDTLFPEVGQATVTVLERLGVTVDFPPEQTCCGQMHVNSGYAREGAALARRFVEVFDGWDVVVTPSGSCAAHVRKHCPEVAVVELSEFLARQEAEVGASWPGRVTYHPTCHSLRLLGLADAPTRLLRAVDGLELVELPEADVCCGFGGTFAVKNAEVSSAMLTDKIAAIEASGADAVCACDSSCLMHIGGGLEKRGSPVRAIHLAEILASVS